MAKSLTLALYLLAAGHGAAASRPAGPERPRGPLIWLHIGQAAGLKGLAHLARSLRRQRPAVHLLVTDAGTDTSDLSTFPGGTLVDAAPDDRPAMVRQFLDHWRPDLVLIAGNDLPPAIISRADELGLPLMLIDVHRPAYSGLGNLLWRGMHAALLSRFRQILARDAATAKGLRRMCDKGTPIDIAGTIEDATEPLHCNEVERQSLATLLNTRPVWLAVACPEAEEDAVIAAHEHAMRFAHRMLLILVPANQGRARELAARVAREGWIVALRSREEEPEADVQVFVADGEGELGLWYRLAPVTFMGGTLTGNGSPRNPNEPAALGSAVLHGPHVVPYPEAYAQLAAARAVRPVQSATSLAEAVTDLIAPDKAAMLAHNAWAASSGGAEVTERLVQMVIDELPGQSALAGQA